MKIGIDVSQIAYSGTGVGNFVKNLIEQLQTIDHKNEYILFYSSLRGRFQFPFASSGSHNITLKRYFFPPFLLDILWNRLHIFPIEWFIGRVDIFLSSDWTEPPAKHAKKATILYDLIVYTFPKETDEKIVAVHKRKLAWVKKESDLILCISEATKQDAKMLLGIDEKRLRVIYPGI